MLSAEGALRPGLGTEWSRVATIAHGVLGFSSLLLAPWVNGGPNRIPEVPQRSDLVGCPSGDGGGL